MNSSKDDFGIMFTNNAAGYLSSNRKGGRGLDDIYQFKIAPPVVASAQNEAGIFYAVEGVVTESASGQPMENVLIRLLNRDTGKEKTTVSDQHGKFTFDLEPGMDYVVKGDSEKYFSKQEGHISTKNVPESTIFTVKFDLERAQDAYLVRLNNIYYDFNKWTIRRDAIPELNNVMAFARSMPDVRIELRAHTDARGKAVYNQWLSQKRAQSALDYLLAKGVNGSNLTAVGLGESELLNHCRDNVKCSERAHQLNRRTEFRVINVIPESPLASVPLASAR